MNISVWPLFRCKPKLSIKFSVWYLATDTTSAFTTSQTSDSSQTGGSSHNMHRRTTKKNKLYSGASSAPITPAGADQKPSDKEKPTEEEKPSEEEKPLEETPVEDGGMMKKLKHYKQHALEVKRRYFLTFW